MIAYKMRIIDLVNGKLRNDSIGGVVLSTLLVNQRKQESLVQS